MSDLRAVSIVHAISDLPEKSIIFLLTNRLLPERTAAIQKMTFLFSGKVMRQNFCEQALSHHCLHQTIPQ